MAEKGPCIRRRFGAMEKRGLNIGAPPPADRGLPSAGWGGHRGKAMPEDGEDSDPWTLFRPLVGTWEGTGGGKPGEGKEVMDCEFVLQDKFLRIRNRSRYKPQEKNPEGEVHEDWGFLSHDKIRDTFVLREFHVEGYVNEYILDHVSEDGKTLVFLTESLENVPEGWRGRETFRYIGTDEFHNTFELARPGEDFEVYVETRLRRQA
jgi:hypothetical protein